MKLKASQVAATRQRLLDEHGGLCEVCGHPVENPNLDHDHKTGAIRGTICRKCNGGIGAIERVVRYGIKDILGFVEGAAAYLRRHSVNRTGLIHPSHFTTEEKKARAKARAAKKRKVK